MAVVEEILWFLNLGFPFSVVCVGFGQGGCRCIHYGFFFFFFSVEVSVPHLLLYPHKTLG